MKHKFIWITWENQIRNKSMSDCFDAAYFELPEFRPRFIRYIVNLFKTTLIFIRENPVVIFAQNPSIILSMFSVLYGKLTNKMIVLDCHNAGIFPLEGKFRFLNYLVNLVNKNAFMVIVSNDNLKKYCDDHGCNAYVLPDPLPKINALSSGNVTDDRFKVLYITTWSADEPYHDVLSIKLPKEYVLYVSGNYKNRIEPDSYEMSGNIVLTGFLSRSEYDELLNSVDCVMALTTRDDCLLCGAYEGVACGKPMILSDKKAIREYFRYGALYTDNSSINIYDCIKEMKRGYEQHKQDIEKLSVSLEYQWNERFRVILGDIESRVP